MLTKSNYGENAECTGGVFLVNCILIILGARKQKQKQEIEGRG